MPTIQDPKAFKPIIPERTVKIEDRGYKITFRLFGEEWWYAMEYPGGECSGWGLGGETLEDAKAEAVISVDWALEGDGE